MSSSFDAIKNNWQKDADFQKEYDALDVRFLLARSIIEARIRAGLTQEELANRMGTSQPEIARLESGHKPSLKTLEHVARVTGSKLMIQLVPEDAHPA